MKISDILIEATPQSPVGTTPRDEIISPLSKEARTKLKQYSRDTGGQAAGDLHAMTGDPLGHGPRNKGTALAQSVAQTKQSAANVGLSGSKDVIDKKEFSDALSGMQQSTNKMTGDFLDAGERQLKDFKKTVGPVMRAPIDRFTSTAEKLRKNLKNKISGSKIAKQQDPEGSE